MIIFIIIGISVFIITNLLRQVNAMEEELTKEVQNTFNVYNFILIALSEAYNDLKRIDKKGAFSSDDEVGFAFAVILESIHQVKHRIEKMKNDDTGDG